MSTKYHLLAEADQINSIVAKAPGKPVKPMITVLPKYTSVEVEESRVNSSCTAVEGG